MQYESTPVDYIYIYELKRLATARFVLEDALMASFTEVGRPRPMDQVDGVVASALEQSMDNLLYLAEEGNILGEYANSC